MTEEQIPIRNARPEDVRPVYRFLKPFVAAHQLLPRTMNELSVLLKHGFVAEYQDDIVGFAAVEVYSPKMAEIQCLAVAPEHQRKGLGRRLVQRCIDRAIAQNVCELMAITASEKLFQDCGFDYSLPGQKRALFIQTNNRRRHERPD
jgi:N-acetylglutamate synthase-like GNAT family acetyltransferase